MRPLVTGCCMCHIVWNMFFYIIVFPNSSTIWSESGKADVSLVTRSKIPLPGGYSRLYRRVTTSYSVYAGSQTHKWHRKEHCEGEDMIGMESATCVMTSGILLITGKGCPDITFSLLPSSVSPGIKFYHMVNSWIINVYIITFFLCLFSPWE